MPSISSGVWTEVLARYLPPTSESPTEVELGSIEALDEILDTAACQRSDRGVSAVELTREEGSTLVVAQAGSGAVLLWIDSLGRSFHSVGSGSSVKDTVVFDYFGSYTEVPAEFVVPLEFGRASAHAFLVGEHPATTGLALEPD